MNLRKNKTHTEEPAYSVVKRLGGGAAVARRLDITPGAITRWMSKDGCNGVIPQKHWGELFRMGRELGVSITLQDLKG